MSQKIRTTETARSAGMWVSVILAIAWGTGCRTTGYQKSDATAESMRMLATAVHAERQELKTSAEALETLVHRPGADLRPQLKAFDIAVDRLNGAVELTDRRLKRVQEDSQDYLASWQRETDSMNYEAIRNHAEVRRAAVSNDVVTITRQYQDSREALMPLLAYLEDIRKTLNADLTMDGLASVEDIVAKTRVATDKVESNLADLTTRVVASGNRFASVGSRPMTADNAIPAVSVPPPSIEAPEAPLTQTSR
jgi:DUF2959 family protein